MTPAATSPSWSGRRPRSPCPATRRRGGGRPARSGRAYRRRWPAPRSASTGPAWPPTTGPTASSTPSSGPSGRSRPAGSRPAQALGARGRAHRGRPGLAALAGGRRAAGASRSPLAAAVWAYDLRPRTPRPARRRWPPAAGWTCCSARRRPAARGRAGRAAVVAAHTYTVTALSRGEVARRRRHAAAATLAGTAAAAAAGAPSRRPRRRGALPPCSPAGTPAATAAAQAAAAAEPVGRAGVRAAVGAGITGLPPLQGALTAAGRPPARPAVAGRRAAGPAAGPEGVPDMTPARRRGGTGLRFGYGTNGFANHRLADALAVIADLGYDGVALTLDHDHLDPFAARPGRAGSPRSPTAAQRWAWRWSSRPAPATCSTRGASTRPRCCTTTASRRIDFLRRAVASAPTWAPRRCRSGPASARPGVDRRDGLGPAGRAAAPQVVDAADARGRAARRSSPSRACSSRTSPAGGGCTPRWATRRGFGITLDIGHCRCLEPTTGAATASAAVADAPGQRADRRHAPGRARAPGVRRRRDRLPAGAARPARRSATAGWSRSSCPGTPTPRPPWPPARSSSCAAAAAAATRRCRHSMTRRPARLRRPRPTARRCALDGARWPRVRGRPGRRTRCCCPRAPAREVGRAPRRPRGAGDARLEDAERGRLLRAAGRRAASRRPRRAEVARLYRHGDAAEKRAVLRGPAAAATSATRGVPTCCTTRCAPTTPGWSPPRSARTRAPPRRPRPGGRACSSACSWACRWPPSTASTTGPTPSWPRCSPRCAAERAAAGRALPGRRRRTCSTGSPPRLAREACMMRIFDPHIHMTSRTTDDYERMAAAGVRAVVEPAFWLGQPRTSLGSFADYFDSLIGWEPFRAAQFGIRHHCTIALNPKEANDPRCRGGARPAAALPGQGRRGRGRRDRLRLDDARGGRGVRRAARAGRRARAAGAGAHPAPGQGARHPAHPRRGRASPASTRAGCVVDHLNEVTVDLVARLRLLAGLLHLPRHQDVAAPDGGDPAEYGTRADAGQLGRRLGPLRPAADRGDRRGDARGRVHRRRRRPGAVAQPGRVLRPVRPAAARPDADADAPPATFAGNSHPARGAR